MINPSKRIRKITGNFETDDFKKILSQLSGKAIFVLVVLNSNCEECNKVSLFIKKLENGLIKKLPKLVLFYGYNNTPLKKIEEGEEGREEREEKTDSEPEDKKKKSIGDSRLLSWNALKEDHGYGIFISEEECQIYDGNFEHDDFSSNITDALRRFGSHIISMEDLTAKRKFIEDKKSGIIIESKSSTSNNQILELEKKVKLYKDKIPLPFYFLKGLTKEISYINRGSIVFKHKGLNMDKFVKELNNFLNSI